MVCEGTHTVRRADRDGDMFYAVGCDVDGVIGERSFGPLHDLVERAPWREATVWAYDTVNQHVNAVEERTEKIF